MHRPARISRRSSAPPAIWLMSCTAVLLCAQLPKPPCVASFTLGQCEILPRKGRTVRHLVQLKGGVLGAGGIQDGLGALAEGAAAPAEHHHLRLAIGRARSFRSAEQCLAVNTTTCGPQRRHRSNQERRGGGCSLYLLRTGQPLLLPTTAGKSLSSSTLATGWRQHAAACPPLPQLAVAAHEVALEAPQHTTVRSCISGGFRNAQRTGLSAMYLSIAALVAASSYWPAAATAACTLPCTQSNEGRWVVNRSSLSEQQSDMGWQPPPPPAPCRAVVVQQRRQAKRSKNSSDG